MNPVTKITWEARVYFILRFHSTEHHQRSEGRNRRSHEDVPHIASSWTVLKSLFCWWPFLHMLGSCDCSFMMSYCSFLPGSGGSKEASWASLSALNTAVSNIIPKLFAETPPNQFVQTKSLPKLNVVHLKPSVVVVMHICHPSQHSGGQGKRLAVSARSASTALQDPISKANNNNRKNSWLVISFAVL